MKKLIKYLCIVMIVMGAVGVFFEGYLILRSFSGAPAAFTLSFINHVGMLIVGIMGIKFRDDDEKQKMLAGISGMQTLFCLIAVIISNTLYITLKSIGIADLLSIICSVAILVYYVKGMIRVKKENKIE